MKLTNEEVAKAIWPQLQNAKFKEYYIDLLLERFQKRDKAINIFIVIVTSTSVSAWAIWKYEYLQWVWAVLVALSQLVLLIKPYLNYSKYVKELSEKYYILQALNLEYEKLWRNFKFDKLPLDTCYDKEFELRTSLITALKFGDGIILTDNKKIKDIAQERVLTYLKLTFNYKNEPKKETAG